VIEVDLAHVGTIVPAEAPSAQAGTRPGSRSEPALVDPQGVPSPQRPRIQELPIESLLDSRSVPDLDRALLDVAWQAGVGPAVALWRRVVLASSPGGAAWRPVRSRGAVELLPLESQVRAVLDGGLDERLPGGATVIAAPSEECGAALVVVAGPAAGGGAAELDPDALDVASALLSLYAVLAGPFAAEPDGGDSPGSLGAPLPAPREERDPPPRN
jgi:hypothetical protein